MKRSVIRECIRKAQRKNSAKLHPYWDGFKHYCFIIQGNHIIEMGVNRKGRLPFSTRYRGYQQDDSIHAEVDAYRKAKGILNHRKPFEALVIRLNKSGELRNSEPCNECKRFLACLDCRNIYFSTAEGQIAQLV